MKFFVFVHLALLFSIIVESHLIQVPTRVDSITQQCVNAGFEAACKVKPSIDDTRMCMYPIKCAVKVGKFYRMQSGKMAKNGTPCAENKICWNYACRGVDTMPDINGSIETVKCKGIVPFASRVNVQDPAENEVYED